MTTDQFITIVERMRSAQIAYFAADHNSSAKRVHLQESKALEKMVDEAIKSFKSNQLKLL